MPKLVQLPGGSICVFSGDHPPPHFHVRSNTGAAAQVKISTLAVLNGSVDRALLRRALAWAEDNKPLLERKWKELNS